TQRGVFVALSADSTTGTVRTSSAAVGAAAALLPAGPAGAAALPVPPDGAVPPAGAQASSQPIAPASHHSRLQRMGVAPLPTDWHSVTDGLLYGGLCHHLANHLL